MSDLNLHIPRPVKGVRLESAGWAEEKKTDPAQKPRIIKSGSAQQRPQWSQFQNSDKVIEDLEKEYQERSEAAYKFGYDDGRKIGYQEGKEDIAPAVAALGEMKTSFHEKQADLLQEADEMVVRLAVAIARQILLREVKTDRALILEVAREALKRVEDRQRVMIRVNPDDWQAIKSFEEEIKSPAHGIKHLEIKEDPEVTAGGCVFESDSGVIDAQMEVQLDEIAASLFEEFE